LQEDFMICKPHGLLLALSILSSGIGLMTVPATAQNAPAATKRLALVIGNSGYQHVTKLTNPVNDANDMAAKLKALQFEVLLATDASQTRMAALLEEFRQKVTKEHVALVFYAGHGVTVNRESFLLPVDAPTVIELDDKGEPKPDAVNRQMVSMAAVLAPLEASKIGIVFLDACRNNAADPNIGMSMRMVSLGQSRSLRVIRGTGSLQIKASPHSAGVFRAYATQLDNVASDGAGRNSPFTTALLKHIGTKGITIQELMIRVRKSVVEETRGEQVPWEEAALNELFYFVQGAPAPLGGTGAKNGTGGGGGAAAARQAPKKSTLPPNLGTGVGAGF
jgi:uncharacterized caspase-like protein